MELSARAGKLRTRAARVLSTAAKATWFAYFALMPFMVVSYAPYPHWFEALTGALGLASLGGIVAMIASYFLSTFPAWRDAARVAVVREKVLSIGGEEHRVENAIAHATPSGDVRVEITSAGNFFFLDGLTAEEASALVHELGFGPAGARARASPWRRRRDASCTSSSRISSSSACSWSR